MCVPVMLEHTTESLSLLLPSLDRLRGAVEEEGVQVDDKRSHN